MLIPQLEPVELAIFLQAARTLNFGEVARVNRMSPPAVTKHISSLEGKLRKKLFWRTTRSVRLTPEGEFFTEAAKRALEALESAEAVLTENIAPEQLTGRIRLSCSYTLAIRRVSHLLQAFHEKHPLITVDMHLSDHAVDLVDEGIDMAIRIMKPEDSSLIARKLAENPVRFYASPKYLKKRGVPKKISQLKHHCLLSIPIHKNLKLKKSGQTLAKAVGDGWLHSVSGDVLVAMAVRGSGVLVRSAWGCEDEVKAGALVELELDDSLISETGIYAVYSPNRFLPRRVRVWIDHLAAGFGV